MVRIAIEATGCDKGFQEIYTGALNALKKYSDLELILVAGRDKLGEYSNPEKIEILLTDYTFDGGETINKRKTSIFRAVELHRKGEVDAVIAPGDTKGSVYASLLLKRIRGVIKPAIPAHLPYNNVLIDVGANPESEPAHLLQFAIMGKIYSEVGLGVKNPLIGLVNIGEEESKGSETVQNANDLIKKRLTDYNLSEKYFEGNTLAEIENLDKGLVAVTNGFVGNTNLKLAEKLLKLPYKLIQKEIMELNVLDRALANVGLGISYLTLYKIINKLKKNFDSKYYATCPLLGVDGNIMICHGSSDSETITNAVGITKDSIKLDICSRLEKDIFKYGIV